MNNILIGVSGGISAYKVPSLIRLLIKDDYNVKVIVTEDALKFVTKETLEIISGNMVYFKMFDNVSVTSPKHIELAGWADCLLIVPATYNTIGKLAGGIANNLLSLVASAMDNNKLILAPSMNVNMWENKILQSNLNKLKKMGVNIIEPDSGFLACKDTGKGRLPDIEIIHATIKRVLNTEKRFENIQYIVTAGGTEEDIDKVRVISNRSSGRMGIEIAKQLYFKGADVLIIHGNVSVGIPLYLKSVYVKSAEMMLKVINKNIGNNTIIIMAAAISDFKIKNAGKEKYHKKELRHIEFIENIDVIKNIKRDNILKIVGFALENGMDRKSAIEKLKRKNIDTIILNDVSSIGSEHTKIEIIKRKDNNIIEFEGTKQEIAKLILDHI
jgi:phosphopantothenoylcysteine decarboxylase/phosphopantothenate--cysteine ligase